MTDLISRADAIEAIASRDETDGTVKVFTGRQVNEILSALPSAEYSKPLQTTLNSDLISRADAIEAVDTEIRCTDKEDDVSGLTLALSLIFALPSAETHEIRTETHGVCSDFISRADAIKTIHRYKHRLEGRGQTYGFLLEEFENRIPSADAVSREDYHNLLTASNDIDRALREYQAKEESESAESVRGEWIDVNGDGSLWRCDQCKDTACCKGNFCPNCGARMDKGGEDE